MTMIKQLDGIARRRRGDVKTDASGKAIPPEAYNIFFHDDHIGYTQRLPGGKFRAFPIDGSFPTEEHKNHTAAVSALVQAFTKGGSQAPAAPAPAGEAPAQAPAKAAKARTSRPQVQTQLSLVKDEDITPLTTQTGKVLTDTDIEQLADEAERGYDVVTAVPCERCGKTEPHAHATPAPAAAPEPEWDAGYPEGPRNDQPPADPFAALPSHAPADTAAEEPEWLTGPGFAPETPPFGSPVTTPPFLAPKPDDPFEDTFTDPFSEL